MSAAGAAAPVLVTGAAGMIGRAVVEALIAAGRPVLACDRVPPPDPAAFATAVAELTDARRLYALAAPGLDGIIHCGGISGPMIGREHPAGTAAANIGGTVTLLDIARVLRVRRFVFCSSVAAYGDTPAGMDPVGPEAPLAASDVYGASKAAADLMLRAYVRDHGVDAIALRLGWVYGPRRRTASFLQRAIRDALDGRRTEVATDGAYAVPLVYVADVVTALIAAYDAPTLAARALNVTGGTRLPLRALARLVTERLPQADIVFGTQADCSQYRQAGFDIAATERALGWRPRVDLAAGIARYAEWLAENPF